MIGLLLFILFKHVFMMNLEISFSDQTKPFNSKHEPKRTTILANWVGLKIILSVKHDKEQVQFIARLELRWLT